MADDTRQNESRPAIEAPSESEDGQRRPRRPKAKYEYPQTQAGKMWEAFGHPDEPINAMPGGQVNSAGGRPAEVTWRDAFKFSSFSKADWSRFYRTSCAKDSLLVGIGAGGAIGGLRFIVKGISSLAVSANYAVGSFALTATAMYYWCDQRRQKEAQGIAAAVIGMKILNEKKAREKAAEEAAAAETARLAEEQKRNNKRWYKVWS